MLIDPGPSLTTIFTVPPALMGRVASGDCLNTVPSGTSALGS
jgi:hypothetical protein